MASVNADDAWEVVLNRDRHGDGRFVYAVFSTGVYCRPSCPSRPAGSSPRDVFQFAATGRVRRGYRACLRCRPQSLHGSEAPQGVEEARCSPDGDAVEPLTL